MLGLLFSLNTSLGIWTEKDIWNPYQTFPDCFILFSASPPVQKQRKKKRNKRPHRMPLVSLYLKRFLVGPSYRTTQSRKQCNRIIFKIIWGHSFILIPRQMWYAILSLLAIKREEETISAKQIKWKLLPFQILVMKNVSKHPTCSQKY